MSRKRHPCGRVWGVSRADRKQGAYAVRRSEKDRQHGTLVSLCINQKRGVKKHPIHEGYLDRGKGVRGDGHARGGLRQVSLLMQESVDQMRRQGAEVRPGDFAENLVTSGVNLHDIRVGDRIRIGDTELRVTIIGKECHAPCNIYFQVGHCIMPDEGVFCSIERSGPVQVGAPVTVITKRSSSPT